MKFFTSLTAAYGHVEKARRAMAWNPLDRFRVESKPSLIAGARVYVIAMYSHKNGTFCGYY